MKLKRSVVPLVLLLCVVAVGPAWVGGYCWARLTGRLVNYNAFITRPREAGMGPTTEEKIFRPLMRLESRIRRNLPGYHPPFFD